MLPQNNRHFHDRPRVVSLNLTQFEQWNKISLLFRTIDREICTKEYRNISFNVQVQFVWRLYINYDLDINFIATRYTNI